MKIKLKIQFDLILSSEGLGCRSKTQERESLGREGPGGQWKPSSLKPMWAWEREWGGEDREDGARQDETRKQPPDCQLLSGNKIETRRASSRQARAPAAAPRENAGQRRARRRPLWRCQRPHSATQRASARHEACTPSHGHELGTGPLGSSCRPRLQRSRRNGIRGRHVQGRGPGEVMSQRRGHVLRNVPSGDFIGVRTSRCSHARRAGRPAPQA